MSESSAERQRLEEDRTLVRNWHRWGPYVSERSWGTVREDYSPDGEAWKYLTHDQARSKAYRWGEDGIAAICDRYQIICFAPAFWNGRDPFLKERLFGVTPLEANHGEDVKECYYYLDALPTHSYLKHLYKYPQRAFPYERLIAENRRRNRTQPEYELLDTGIFDDDRYFDIFTEYAKSDPEDLCIRLTIVNRSQEPARLHVLPQLWYRNRWGWGAERAPQPVIRRISHGDTFHFEADDSNCRSPVNLVQPYRLGMRYFYAEPGGRPLFTENESNSRRLYGPSATNVGPYVKDAFHRTIVSGENCVNPAQHGTKSAVHYAALPFAPGETRTLRFRLSDRSHAMPLADVDAIIEQRRDEADEFYATIHPPKATADECRIQRQALAGMIWTKQIYLFDVKEWLDGDNPASPPPESRKHGRNDRWRHLNSMRILSMPDKWEYPWFAAWDLAFHCVPLALVDPEFAKNQLWLLLFEQFQHPNGQIPAYEWEFSDLNPPVHAWAVWRVYNMDRVASGKPDRKFLEKCFHKLLINFAWWVNKVDAEGHNVFEGGFLGLDNITVFDRSRKPSDGSVLKQADCTGWMGMFCLNLMRIALELAKENQAYVGLATKFFEHFVYIGSAMKNMGGRNFDLWSNQDGLFYDVLHRPDGSWHRLRVRSLVSLIPLFAVERLEEKWIEAFPEFRDSLLWFIRNRPELVSACVNELDTSEGTTYLLSLVSTEQLRRILDTMHDPEEFRSEFGLRSLSKYHERNPYRFDGETVAYEPGESTSWLKGGNSNWRGPIWFPTSFLMIESLRKFGKAYGPEFQAITTSDGKSLTLRDAAGDFADRMIKLFTLDASGRRPMFGENEKQQLDPHFREHLLFHEFFNAETGKGLGASHQTGWTGLIASLIDEWRR